MRAALYERVSSEEQAIHGLSIEAQTEALDAWAQAEKVYVVGHYTDAGISARKKANHRPALQRLLNDVRAGKIDIIVFTKLDRWFRNISEYYKVQEILEQYHVNWKTIHEDYDTSTASGRLKINIMLSVAQDEADRTSERIKTVFESKLSRGEPVSGKVPFGYKIENKKIVPDPATAPIAQDIFNQYIALRSVAALRRYIINKFNIVYSLSGLRAFLVNERYIGKAHGQTDFCEGIIDPSTFNLAQTIISERAQRHGVSYRNRIYLFKGIVSCAECGNNLSAHTVSEQYIYYRCSKHEKSKTCPHQKLTSELFIEDWLLKNVLSKIAEYNLQVAEANKNRPVIDESLIRRKISKLRDLYLNDLIDRDDYEQEYISLRKELSDAIQGNHVPILQEIDLEPIQTALKAYNNLEKSLQKEFWSRILKKIIITNEENFFIVPNLLY